MLGSLLMRRWRVGVLAIVAALTVALAQGAARSQEKNQGAGAVAAQKTPGPSGKEKKPPPEHPALTRLKQEAADGVDSELVQEIVDSVFSFGELGFQETKTSEYLTGILEENGFNVQRGIAGIPTAWMATWGSGKPVIALGSDIDGIPRASQKPGVAYRDPLVAGAPSHGEGHNSGQAVNIAAALPV